jgi:hypothetical protein
MADFKVEADSEFIVIDGFRFAPAEADRLKQAVSFAGSMRDLPRLPPEISFEQFTISFFEDGTLTVRRATDVGGEIKFSFNTVDILVTTIESALGISIDRKRLRPSPRSVGDPGFLADADLIEG